MHVYLQVLQGQYREVVTKRLEQLLTEFIHTHNITCDKWSFIQVYILL